MSIKPTVGQLPVWDTGLVNTSAITAGHQTSGWPTNAIPTSSELNSLFAFLYLWAKYLSDGALSGVSSFDNTLAVTGVITATAGVTVGVNQNVAVSGSGFYKRGPKVRKLSACLAAVSAGLNTGFQWVATAGAQTITFPIELLEGERLTSVTARVMCSAAADGLTCKVFQVQPLLFTSAQLGSTATSVGHAAAIEALTVSGLTEVASTSNIFSYYVSLTTTGYTSGSSVYSLEVTTDVP